MSSNATAWTLWRDRGAPGAAEAVHHGGWRAAAAVMGTAALLLTLLVVEVGVPVTAGGVVLLLAALLLCVMPETAALVGVAALYGNLVVAFDGSPLYQLAGAAPIGLLAIPAAYHLLIRHRAMRIDAVFCLLVAYLAVLLASTLVAVDMPLALTEIVQYGTEGLLLYWLLINAVRSQRALRGVLAATVTVCGLLAAMSVYQTMTGRYEQQFGGLAQRALPDGEEDGAVRASARPEAGVSLEERAAGPIGDANRYAQILLVVLPWAVYFTRHAGSAQRRLASRVAVTLIAAAIALTYSRGAFLALVPLAACLWAWRYVSVGRLIGAGLIGTCLVVIVAPSYGARMATIAGVGALGEEDGRTEPDGAIRGRATEMLAALAVFLDHPWLGVGPGQYVPSYSERYQLLDEVSFRSLPRPREAHSLYLSIAAETGLSGLAAFGLIVGVAFLALGRARRSWHGLSASRADLAAALQASLVAYLATGVFLHLSYERYFWFLLGTIGAAILVLRHERVAGMRAG